MLTDMKARKARCPEDKRQVKLTDGRGLYLLVTRSGGKYWRFDYRWQGKRKTLALGVYPEVSLEDARNLLTEARKQLASGVDPAINLRARARRRGDITFAEVCSRWLEKKKRDGLAASTLKNIKSRMQAHVLPAIGDAPLAAVKTPHVLELLRQIERSGKIHTAHRVKRLISQVYRFAIACGEAESDPTYGLQDALVAEKPESRAAIVDPRELGRLLRAIASYGGHVSVRNGLEMLARTFVRPGELRLARWEEIDLQNAMWRVPAERMKMRGRGDHLVPLSSQCIRILEEQARRFGRDGLIFPGTRPRTPMSDATLNMALRALGYDNKTHVSHGFRATARTLLSEQGWPIEAIERQLAHAHQSRTARAYARAEYLEVRREMMQKWSDYLDGLMRGGE
ncbi:MAG: tyrosine-type recombinase/integrase [Mariprofundaceae bacterium]